MKYLQIDIETNKEDIEPLTGFLLTRGIIPIKIFAPVLSFKNARRFIPSSS